MSIVKTYDVFCDVKGCNLWSEGCTGSVAGSPTKEAREIAANRGWTRVKVNNRLADLCPDCERKRQDNPRSIVLIGE